ncbi:T9SS type A sorting domain-containing protein [Polaribacter litorisediminis]|uniref:T9SS type A sorting domain-containing protein n=1 Tax=Polaribacter litorisediminis TaxID=1908341 RepID=UPI001CBE95A7|nr:T9SS type A sorting domain-containing protein [Polaribacter litorisediminis]UAM96914.1 T9SS type A sorting domain-containing protein [Polaribacter litorisediminis]
MKKIILVFGVLFITYFLNAQSTIASSGADASGDGTSSYTIGHLFYTPNNQNNSLIVQGVQQSFAFQVLSNSEFLLENLILLTYPNPTSDKIIVSNSNNRFHGNLKYPLFNIQGKHMISGLIKEQNTQINIQHLSNGIYFLKVTKQNV